MKNKTMVVFVFLVLLFLSGVSWANLYYDDSGYLKKSCFNDNAFNTCSVSYYLKQLGIVSNIQNNCLKLNGGAGFSDGTLCDGCGAVLAYENLNLCYPGSSIASGIILKDEGKGFVVKGNTNLDVNGYKTSSGDNLLIQAITFQKDKDNVDVSIDSEGHYTFSFGNDVLGESSQINVREQGNKNFKLYFGPFKKGFAADREVITPSSIVFKECSDGVDNDGDGKIDMNDPQCDSFDGDDEFILPDEDIKEGDEGFQPLGYAILDTTGYAATGNKDTEGSIFFAKGPVSLDFTYEKVGILGKLENDAVLRMKQRNGVFVITLKDFKSSELIVTAGPKRYISYKNGKFRDASCKRGPAKITKSSGGKLTCENSGIPVLIKEIGKEEKRDAASIKEECTFFSSDNGKNQICVEKGAIKNLGTDKCSCGPEPECSDGIDNDEDGLVDYPDDSDCSSSDDDSEGGSQGEGKYPDMVYNLGTLREFAKILFEQDYNKAGRTEEELKQASRKLRDEIIKTYPSTYMLSHPSGDPNLRLDKLKRISDGFKIDIFLGAGKTVGSNSISDHLQWVEISVSEGVCGNGNIEDGEECDDGNTLSGDGCSSECMLEGPECINAAYVYDVDMWVVGEGCHYTNKIQDSVSINVPVANVYSVKGAVIRGKEGSCQTNEAFYLEINGKKGPTASDDSNPCAVTSKLDDLGVFDLSAGTINVAMHTASKCPPDTHPNSVGLRKICLYSGGTIAPQCSDGIDNDNDGLIDYKVDGTGDPDCTSVLE